MPGRISEQDIQALRERADLAGVVGDHTSLTRAGSRLKGLCPFHAEKTPSFTVDPARGFFHCFGCGEGGDVYAFLQKAEALSFPEAVERLARLDGYELRYEELTPGQRRALGRRTRLSEAVAAAAEFYQKHLDGDEGGAARAYLGSRGVDAAAAASFRLGWAPDGWDGLVRHLLGRGFDPAEVVDAGLATHGRQGPTDRFRGRVMFPILDPGGRDVIAFGGRVLPGVELRTAPRDATPPKYINSPETEVYKKARTLYALNWSRVEMQRQQAALVVEGYMDVIGLHLAGVRHVVATCGTALTAEHFRLLEKHTPRVVLALDADDAGYAAAEKARALAAEVGMREVAVLPLPSGQDPADLASGGRETVEIALKGLVTAVEFQISHLLRTADIATPEGQVDAYRRTFPLLAGIPDRFLRYRYVRDVVAPAVRLNADLIERELDRVSPGGPAAPPASGPTGAAVRPGALDLDATDPQVRYEANLLQVALQRPDLLPDVWKGVAVGDFRAPASRQLFAALAPGASGGGAGAGGLEATLARLPDDDARREVRALALADLRVEADPAAVAQLVGWLQVASVTRRYTEVRDHLGRVHPHTDAERYRALRAELMELERRRRELAEGRDA